MRALLTLCLLVFVADAARAELLMYEGFNYPAGERLIGQTNANGKTWIDPTAPIQPGPTSTPASPGDLDGDGFSQVDPQVLEANDIVYPGLASTPGNHFDVPKGILDAPNDGSTQGNIVRTVLPLPAGRDPVTGSYTSSDSSLFYSFTLRLTQYGGSQTAPNLIAGFHWGNDVVGSGMSNTAPFVGSLRLRPSAGGTYQLGLSKDGNAPGVVWDTATYTPLEDTLLVVVEYDLVGNNTSAANTDDVARLWINPAPGQPAGVPTLVVTAGADPFASQAAVPAQSIPFVAASGAIRSFYFRSDRQTPGLMHVDDLRIGTTFADVTPAVPEPSTMALAALGIVAIGMRRRYAA